MSNNEDSVATKVFLHSGEEQKLNLISDFWRHCEQPLGLFVTFSSQRKQLKAVFAPFAKGSGVARQK